MNETHQAQQLAEWLEAHPGQQPPQDVDPDVLEAVYALRPDLAPAPCVSIDDILGGVSSGPFASAEAQATPGKGMGETTEDTEVIQRGGSVVDLEAHRSRRLRRWAPVVGALAVAAMAMIVVIPAKDTLLVTAESPFADAEVKLEGSDFKRDEVELRKPSASATPTDSTTRQAVKDVSGLLDEVVGGAPGTVEEGEEELQREQQVAPFAKARPSAKVISDSVAGEDPSLSQPRGDDALRSLGYVAAGGEAPEPTEGARLETAVPVAEAIAPQDGPAFPATGQRAAEAAPTTIASSDKSASDDRYSQEVKKESALSLDEEFDYADADAIVEEAEAAPQRRRTKRSAGRASSAPQEQEPASAPTPPPAPSVTSSVASGTEALDALRQQAWPISGPSALAGLDEATLVTKLEEDDPTVVMQAAYELARLQIQRGATDEAIATIARGLGASAIASSDRARLLALQGEVLEQRGDAASARRSYKDAARVLEALE